MFNPHEIVTRANAPEARSLSQIARNRFSRFALIAGGTPAVPANHLKILMKLLAGNNCCN